VPTQSHTEQIDAAAMVRAAGFEPVPHLAARRFKDAAELRTLFAGLRREARVRAALLIGGDCATPAGPFDSASSLIERGNLRESGIEEVGIAGYPDGHPTLTQDELARAFEVKVRAAERAGLRLHVVSQFCFDAGRIVAWLRTLRAQGFAQPARVGIVGPTSLPTLLRYAKRCGVRTSVRGVMRDGVIGTLLAGVDPEDIVDALAAAGAEIGDTMPHFFSFGGLARAALFVQAAAGTRRPPVEKS
jgi:methylenetetrahydrofolate reductase (NADPH)